MEILRKYRNNLLIKYDGNKYRRYKSGEWYHEPKFFDEYTRYVYVEDPSSLEKYTRYVYVEDPSSLEKEYKRMIRRIKLERLKL